MTLGRRVLSMALSDSTKRTYARVWKQLKEFAQSIQFPQSIPPVSSSLVFLFLTHQVARGISGKSLLTYTSAISYVHKLRNIPDPTNSVVIRKLLIGARKLNPSADLRLPITSSILHRLIQALKPATTSSYNLQLLTAVYLVAFHGFFRIGELLPKSQKQANLVLQLGDMQLWNKEGKLHILSLNIKHSKNMPPGTSENVILHCRTDLCPVTAVQNFLVVRGNASGPLFSLPGGVPYLRSQFDAALWLTVNISQLKDKYLGYSFRIGAATEAAARGMSDSQIRKLGRWNSNAFLSYIRQYTSQ